MTTRRLIDKLILSFSFWCLIVSSCGAQIEAGKRSGDASILLRAASFGATIDSKTTYVLSEYEPGLWVAQAQLTPVSEDHWIVKEAPMYGDHAGFITFYNSLGKKLVLDVLKITTCYGTAGEIRIGW